MIPIGVSKANDIGIGYDIATDLFPDMKRFFKFAHKNDVEIMFNDHPEPYKDAKNVFDEKEVAFREEKLQGILKLGLDYWWYDRNWSTHLNSIDKFIRPETMGDYLFSDITKHYFQKEELRICPAQAGRHVPLPQAHRYFLRQYREASRQKRPHHNYPRCE